MNTATRTQVAINYVLIVGCSLVAVYPLLGVILASLYPPGPRSAPSGFALPPSFDWRSYGAAWNQSRPAGFAG